MKRLWQVEAALVRVESGLMIGLVLLMLALAGYNVLFRNVLVPLQLHWAHSGPPIGEGATASADPAGPEAADGGPAGGLPEAEPGGGDGAEGFGGFGDAEPTPDAKAGAEFGDDEPKDEPKEGEDFGGFGDEPKDEPKDEAKEGEDFGGFGDEPKDEAKAEPKAEPKEGEDFGGFGDEPKDEAKAEPKKEDEGADFGGFGEDEPEPPAPKPEPKAEPKKEDEGADFGGFGEGEPAAAPGEAPKANEGEDFGGFGDAAGAEAEAPEAADEFGASPEDDVFANLDEFEGPSDGGGAAGPMGGPPPEGSFAAWAVSAIDAIKIDWIDVLLRQLVVIVGFLGAAVATQRGRHINVDAVSRVLSASGRRWAAVATNLLATGVCGVLAWSGKRLVDIGRTYPNEILPFVDEWMLQLMFPVGFGLLVFHFAIRTIEALTGNTPPEQVPATKEAAQ